MENLNRENLPNRNDIVILALVATSTKKDVEEFKKLGVNEFTYKPLSEEIVMEIYQKYWVMV
jgi:CheY-like chemotaxis protein